MFTYNMENVVKNKKVDVDKHVYFTKTGKNYLASDYIPTRNDCFPKYIFQYICAKTFS
jgi:hypothetical protein